MKRIIILSTFILGCGDIPSNYFENITNYNVNPDKITPYGIRIDTGGFRIDLDKLDERINDIEECILDVAKITKNNLNWNCIRETERLRRDLFAIKIVQPVLSKCSDWQFINVKAPDELCKVKGVVPTIECPCLWRCAVQDDWVLITTPVLYLWDVGRIMTSCNDIWNSPYSKCLNF